MTEQRPREVVIFTPPGGYFIKASYPWLKAVRITLVGGDGAPGKYGEPGGKGEVVSGVQSAALLPYRLKVSAGRGRRGFLGFGSRGGDAYVMIELFDTEVEVVGDDR